MSDSEADIRLIYDLLAGFADADENQEALARHLGNLQQPVDSLVRQYWQGSSPSGGSFLRTDAGARRGPADR